MKIQNEKWKGKLNGMSQLKREGGSSFLQLSLLAYMKITEKSLN